MLFIVLRCFSCHNAFPPRLGATFVTQTLFVVPSSEAKGFRGDLYAMIAREGR